MISVLFKQSTAGGKSPCKKVAVAFPGAADAVRSRAMTCSAWDGKVRKKNQEETFL